MKKRHGENPTAKRKMPVPRQLRKKLEDEGWIPVSDNRLNNEPVTSIQVTLPSDAEKAYITGLESYIHFLQ